MHQGRDDVSTLGRGPSNVDGGMADGASTGEGSKERGRRKVTKQRGRAMGRSSPNGGRGPWPVDEGASTDERDQGFWKGERTTVACWGKRPRSVHEAADDGCSLGKLSMHGGRNDGTPTREGMMVYRWGRAVG